MVQQHLGKQPETSLAKNFVPLCVLSPGRPYGYTWTCANTVADTGDSCQTPRPGIWWQVKLLFPSPFYSFPDAQGENYCSWVQAGP